MNRREAIQRAIGVLAGLPVVGQSASPFYIPTGRKVLRITRNYRPTGWTYHGTLPGTGSDLFLGKPVGTIRIKVWDKAVARAMSEAHA